MFIAARCSSICDNVANLGSELLDLRKGSNLSLKFMDDLHLLQELLNCRRLRRGTNQKMSNLTYH
jgi:hypothetical protein